MFRNCNPTVQHHIPEDLNHDRGIYNEPLVQYAALIRSYGFAVYKFTYMFLCLACPVIAKSVWIERKNNQKDG
jgi:hypothetical protein